MNNQKMQVGSWYDAQKGVIIAFYMELLHIGWSRLWDGPLIFVNLLTSDFLALGPYLRLRTQLQAISGLMLKLPVKCCTAFVCARVWPIPWLT